MNTCSLSAALRPRTRLRSQPSSGAFRTTSPTMCLSRPNATPPATRHGSFPIPRRSRDSPWPPGNHPLGRKSCGSPSTLPGAAADTEPSCSATSWTTWQLTGSASGGQDPGPFLRLPPLRGHPGLLGAQRLRAHRHDRPAAWLGTRQPSGNLRGRTLPHPVTTTSASRGSRRLSELLFLPWPKNGG
jgi:hypothetical protein